MINKHIFSLVMVAIVNLFQDCFLNSQDFGSNLNTVCCSSQSVAFFSDHKVSQMAESWLVCLCKFSLKCRFFFNYMDGQKNKDLIASQQMAVWQITTTKKCIWTKRIAIWNELSNIYETESSPWQKYIKSFQCNHLH